MGKSASKLRAKRSQSISWSFRFPSMTALHQSLAGAAQRHNRNNNNNNNKSKQRRRRRSTASATTTTTTTTETTGGILAVTLVSDFNNNSDKNGPQNIGSPRKIPDPNNNNNDDDDGDAGVARNNRNHKDDNDNDNGDHRRRREQVPYRALECGAPSSAPPPLMPAGPNTKSQTPPAQLVPTSDLLYHRPRTNTSEILGISRFGSAVADAHQHHDLHRQRSNPNISRNPGNPDQDQVQDDSGFGRLRTAQLSARTPIRPAIGEAGKEDQLDKADFGPMSLLPQDTLVPEQFHQQPQPQPQQHYVYQQQPESIRKLVERELRLFDLLDPRDIRSFAWYHGSTLPGGRKGAETEIANDGDFLVRDCTSQPGNYVLTVKHKGQPLHFVINKLVLQPDTVYERVQYQFEDEAFDTVADLITFYVGSKKPISQASGARIVNPCHRKYPLGPLCSNAASESPSTLSLVTRSPPPRVIRKQQRSHSLTPQQSHYHHHQQQQQHHQLSSSPHFHQSHFPLSGAATAAQNHQQSSTLPRAPPAMSQSLMMTNSLSLGRQRISRGISDPTLKHQSQHSQSFYQIPRNVPWNSPHGPPKPPKLPAHPTPPPRPRPHFHSHHHHHHHHQTHQASGSDSGNGSGDSEFEGSSHLPQAIKGVVIRSHHVPPELQDLTGTLASSELDLGQWEALEAQLIETAPIYEIPSIFDVEGFATMMLPPSEHKPLDPTTLRSLLIMLQDTAPRLLASHLTKIDCCILLKPYQDGEGVRAGLCGLELFLMPYAQQLRLDLIERTACMKLLVAVTVLTGQTAAERALTISRWIQVAIDTKTALGNLYGFCNIMLGLCIPQILKLTETWHLMRQKYTDEAFNFEAKLRPMLRAMNECTDPQAPNTTLPHVLPVILMSERTLEDPLGLFNTVDLCGQMISSWEGSGPDCGLAILWAHLEASRKMLDNLGLFRRNSEIALEGCRIDELIVDAFSTEFQVRFLWGSRGSLVGANERHAKFTQVLDAMYEKCAVAEVT